MPEYDVRQLDPQANVLGSHKVTCDIDSDAVGVAYATALRASKDCRAVEVWNGARLVARVPVSLTPRM